MSEQNDKDLRMKSPNTSNWPDGWFVYQDGRVDGPLSAADAFSIKSNSEDGKTRLVSRKGFSQWYPIKDLAEIYRITDSVSETLSVEQRKMEKIVEEASKTTFATASFNAKVQSKQISAKNKPLVGPSSLKSNHVEGQKIVADKQGLAAEADKTPTKVSTQTTILKEYLLVKEELRLGKIRNPWLISFLAIPCTFGLSWGAWISSTFKEIEFHRNGNHNSKFIYGVLGLIPVVHIFVAYALAKKIRMMEQENKYANTSPLLAAVFAIVPPFSVAYLQDALNQHWTIHVKYSLHQKQKNT